MAATCTAPGCSWNGCSDPARVQLTAISGKSGIRCRADYCDRCGALAAATLEEYGWREIEVTPLLKEADGNL